MQYGINLHTDSLRLDFHAGRIPALAPSHLKTGVNNMAPDHEALNALRIERDAEPPEQPGKARKLLIIAIAALVAISIVAVWFNSSRAVEVEAIEAAAASPGSQANAASVLDASGYVVARRLATVSAKMTGQIEQVMIEEGDHVKEGQVLARLDGSTVRKQYDLSVQQLDATRAQLEEVKVRLADAQRAAKRAEQLRAGKLISEADYDTAHTNAAALQAQLEALQSQVTVSEANVRVQKQYVDDLEVRAPFSGVVISKDAQPGEIISPMSAGGGFTRTGIATIVDMESREIEVDVNEAFIHRVVPDMKTEAILDAYPSWIIPSHVISIVPTADRAKATVKVRIAFNELDPRILPDMGVKVRFLDSAETEGNTVASAVELPATAVVTDAEHHYVWRINDNRIERVAVNAGDEHNGRVQIIAGIQAGDRIVNNPAASLQDGMKVRIKS